MQAGGFWGLGSLMFFVFGGAYALSCCCRKPTYRNAKKADTCCARNCGSRCGYLTTVTLLTAAMLAAITFVARYSSGVGDGIAALNDVKGLLYNSSRWVNTDLASSLTAVTNSTTELQAAAVTAGAPPNVITDIDTMLTAVTASGAAVTSLGSTLAAVVSDLDAQVRTDPANDNQFKPPTDGSYVDLSAAKYGLSVGAWVLVGLALFWFLLQAAFLRATKCAAILFKVALFVTLIAAVLVLVLNGIVYAAALIGSDICVEPTTVVTRALNATSGTGASLAADSLAFYANCAAQPGLAPAGAYASAVDSSAQLVAAFVDLAAVSSAVAPYPALQPLVDQISANLSAANATLNLLTDAISCTPVSGLWDRLITGLCGGIEGVVELALALSATSFLLLFILGFGAAVCYHHPGDAVDIEEVQDKYGSLDGIKKDNPYASIVSPGASYQNGGPAKGVAARFSAAPTGAAAPTAGAARTYEWK